MILGRSLDFGATEYFPRRASNCSKYSRQKTDFVSRCVGTVCRQDGSASSSLSKTDLVPAATSPRRPSLYVIRSFWLATNNTVNTTLYEKLDFNFSGDIAPVASILRFPNVMEVNSTFPTKTVREFIAYAKANPGLASFRCAAEFCRYRGIADSGGPSAR
jgi:hypothetical protein